MSDFQGFGLGLGNLSLLSPAQTRSISDIPPQGYTAFTTPFLGLSQILTPDGGYQSQQRFGMYRWHIMDPIRFHSELRVTIQALGWRSGGRYLPLQDDIASTAFWYQKEPASSVLLSPTADALEVI